jgi:hypothetical protein
MNNRNRISIGGTYAEIYGHFDFQATYSLIASHLKEGDTFVEVGSAWGKSAVYMMEKLYELNKNINFYCVDIFTQESDIDNIEFPFGNGKEYRNRFKNETLYYDFIYNINNSYAKKHKPMPIKSYSDMSAELFNELSCKAVFIDASHEYDSVKKDLQAWWPKIENDGILAGHDFYSIENRYDHDNGVAKAVKNFIDENKLSINHLHGSTFLIHKLI